MTRVGFVLQTWLGGLNYLRNLFTAIHAAPDLALEPVFLLQDRGDVPEDLRHLEVETVRTPLLREGDPRSLARCLIHRAVGRDLLFARFLAHSRIDVLSHSWHLGRSARIPALCWIPDFQHRRIPSLFSPRERSYRDALHASCCRYSTRVIVSSETARADLAEFHPDAAWKARVLHFVDCSSPTCAEVPLEALETRYDGARRDRLLAPAPAEAVDAGPSRRPSTMQRGARPVNGVSNVADGRRRASV